MRELQREQVDALQRIQVEMAAKIAGGWQIVVSGEPGADAVIDLEVLVPAISLDRYDELLKTWSEMVPGYTLDGAGHGQQREDGLCWRAFHLVPILSPDTN